MSDLIRRYNVLIALHESGLCYDNWLEVRNEINAIPSAESVEIVRCKDCIHAEHRKQMPNQAYCKRDKLSTFCVAHDDDDFCKYGERKEE